MIKVANRHGTCQSRVCRANDDTILKGSISIAFKENCFVVAPAPKKVLRRYDNIGDRPSVKFADNYSDRLLYIDRRCKLRSREMTRTVAKQYPNLGVQWQRLYRICRRH